MLYPLFDFCVVLTLHLNFILQLHLTSPPRIWPPVDGVSAVSEIIKGHLPSQLQNPSFTWGSLPTAACIYVWDLPSDWGPGSPHTLLLLPVPWPTHQMWLDTWSNLAHTCSSGHTTCQASCLGGAGHCLAPLWVSTTYWPRGPEVTSSWSSCSCSGLAASNSSVR